MQGSKEHIQLAQHMFLCREYDRLYKRVSVEYNHLIAWHAECVYGAIVDTPRSAMIIGITIWASLHEDCKNRSVQNHVCDIPKEYEYDVSCVVAKMVDDHVLASEISSYAQMRSPNKQAYRLLAEYDRVNDELRNSAVSILHEHVFRAIWMKKLRPEEMSPLQTLISDLESLKICHFIHEEAKPVAFNAIGSISCLKNTQRCRGCLNDITRKPVPCEECKCIFFCSRQCMIQNGWSKKTGHKNVECPLLKLG